MAFVEVITVIPSPDMSHQSHQFGLPRHQWLSATQALLTWSFEDLPMNLGCPRVGESSKVKVRISKKLRIIYIDLDTLQLGWFIQPGSDFVRNSLSKKYFLFTVSVLIQVSSVLPSIYLIKINLMAMMAKIKPNFHGLNELCKKRGTSWQLVAHFNTSTTQSLRCTRR